MSRPEYLTDRPARSQPCPRCGQPTLTAWTGGWHIRCDPQPLTIHQEIAARLLGKQTYDVILIGLPRQMYAEWRSITRIRAPRKYAVIAGHRCQPGSQRPAAIPETEITIPRTTEPLSETPPF